MSKPTQSDPIVLEQPIQRGLQVFDIAELLDQSITYSKPAQPSGNGGSTPQGGETEPEPEEAGAANPKTE